jgi:hypothetical protein
MATLADALRQFGAAYLAEHTLTTPQAKAWRGIVACRTAELGGQHMTCNACDHSHWQYHSCRNRHCPQCGTRAKDAWLQGRLAEVLPVPYAHLVFTLPHSLNGLYGCHPRWLIDMLFACTAQTLSEFAANPKWIGMAGGTPAFSLVLHTWGQELQRHLHAHVVMVCGVLGEDAGGTYRCASQTFYSRWRRPARMTARIALSVSDCPLPGWPANALCVIFAPPLFSPTRHCGAATHTSIYVEFLAMRIRPL